MRKGIKTLLENALFHLLILTIVVTIFYFAFFGFMLLYLSQTLAIIVLTIIIVGFTNSIIFLIKKFVFNKEKTASKEDTY